jgi:carboxyl-terminal processing protease
MLHRRVLLPILLSLLVVPALGQQTGTTTSPAPAAAPALTKEVKDEVLTALGRIVGERAFVPGVDLAKWPEFVAKRQEDLEKSESDTDFARVINLALRDFGISHIRFLAPRAAEARRRTSVVGVGVNGRAGDDGLTITQVFPGSPAADAGLKLNEVIVLVDGVKPDNSQVLMGEDGSEVSLRVRGEDGVERELKLARKPYSTARVDTLTWVDEESAVLRVHSFSNGYRRELIDSLMTEASKAKYLVLDLRSNGGGAVNNLRHLMSLMMPPDVEIGTFISRATAEQHAQRNGGVAETDPVEIAKGTNNKYRTMRLPVQPFSGKIAVLINRGSASASEIAAAALRENREAVIVGAPTAGAVLASVFGRLPHGYEIQYPVSDYVTRNLIRLEKNPVQPDITVTERVEEGRDPVLEQALTRLKGG